MSIVFLNNSFMSAEDAKISPMDRGFLFGDGIYEVIPAYNGKFVGFGPHIDRMNKGLELIGIDFKWDQQQWRKVCDELISLNEGENLGVYLHVSRGTDSKRSHAYPENIVPTVFAYAFEIASANVPDKLKTKHYKVATSQDLRWQRCHIKSTALLGNVMHFQFGHAQGYNETLLYNSKNELTEAGACNAYIVKDGVVITPALDNQILPGITRFMLLDILRNYSDIKVEERTITMDEVFNADEIWLTSSSKEIAAVVEIDGKPVGEGKVGDVWLAAQTQYTAHKFEY